MKLFILSIYCLLLFGCNRPEPKPELADPIYNDIQAELGNSGKALGEAKKQLEDFKGQLEKVVPQNGQYRYFQKHVFDSEDNVARIEQQQKFWTIRLDSRRDFVRNGYLRAFKAGKSWDVTAEYQSYLSEKRLRQARAEWDVRGRRESFLKELRSMRGPAAAGAEGEAGPKPEAPAAKE